MNYTNNIIDDFNDKLEYDVRELNKTIRTKMLHNDKKLHELKDIVHETMIAFFVGLILSFVVSINQLWIGVVGTWTMFTLVILVSRLYKMERLDFYEENGVKIIKYEP